MSTVPPNLVGPILQSPLAQQQLSALRDTERSHSVNARRQQAAAVDAKDSTVETTDSDSQVHTDSEGQGSQGRQFEEPEAQEVTPPEPPPPATLASGQIIDLQA